MNLPVSRIVLGAASLAALLGALALFGMGTFEDNAPLNSPAHNGKEYAIVLTDEGFEPSELSIEAGDTIVFSSTRDAWFWPASNLHPTHTLYPEFDPLEPIPAGESWSFTFEKQGVWRYHDHLAPYYTGVITVQEGGEAEQP